MNPNSNLSADVTYDAYVSSVYLRGFGHDAAFEDYSHLLPILGIKDKETFEGCLRTTTGYYKSALGRYSILKGLEHRDEDERRRVFERKLLKWDIEDPELDWEALDDATNGILTIGNDERQEVFEIRAHSPARDLDGAECHLCQHEDTSTLNTSDHELIHEDGAWLGSHFFASPSPIGGRKRQGRKAKLIGQGAREKAKAKRRNHKKRQARRLSKS